MMGVSAVANFSLGCLWLHRLAPRLVVGRAPATARGQPSPPSADALASRGLVAAFPPVAGPGHPSVIVIHGHNPQATDLENLIDGLKDKGYNVYLFVYEKEMIPHTSAGAFTAGILEKFVGDLKDLTEASSALADAANFLFANETTINLIGFSLGGVLGRGATVSFPDHPEQRTLASNDPKAKPVNIITVDSPVGGMDKMIATGPRVGAFFSGIFPVFYSPFRDGSQWYLNGRTGPNVHHQLGSNLGDEVVSYEGQQLPNGMTPDSVFQTTGSHVGSISNTGNVRIIVNMLEELNGRKVSMSTSNASGTQFFAFGGPKFASFGDAVDTACGVINERYAAANYNTSSCSGTSSANGFEAGVGVSIPLFTRTFLDVVGSYEDFGDLGIDTTGTRANGNLLFNETSQTGFRVFTASVGPSFAPTPLLRLTAYLRVLRWSATETLTDSLRAGVPQVQVQGGAATTSTTGFGWGAGAMVRISVAGPLGVYGAFDAARFSNVFQANGKAGWPEHVSVREFKAGATLTFPY